MLSFLLFRFPCAPFTFWLQGRRKACDPEHYHWMLELRHQLDQVSAIFELVRVREKLKQQTILNKVAAFDARLTPLHSVLTNLFSHTSSSSAHTPHPTPPAPSPSPTPSLPSLRSSKSSAAKVDRPRETKVPFLSSSILPFSFSLSVPYFLCVLFLPSFCIFLASFLSLTSLCYLFDLHFWLTFHFL